MSNTDTHLEQVTQVINKLQLNLKAEVIGSLLSDAGIDKTSIQCNYTSSFNRPYRNDVHRANYNLENKTLDISISRNGLYDMLPEGLFHPETIENEKKISVKTYLNLTKSKRKRSLKLVYFLNLLKITFFNF